MFFGATFLGAEVRIVHSTHLHGWMETDEPMDVVRELNRTPTEYLPRITRKTDRILT
jgi:hypothetical protein